MIVKNEQENLARCLDSIHDHVDEIIVVDTGSNDRTCSIAAMYKKVKLFNFKWNHHFAEARNFGLELSSSRFNLIIDADEYVLEADWEEIYRLLNSDIKFIGRVSIINEFLNDDEEQETASDWISRIIPKGTQYKGRIHEQVNSELKRIKVPISVRHDGYYQTDKSSRNIPMLIRELNESSSNEGYLSYQLGREYMGIKKFDEACFYFEQAYKGLTGKEGYAPNVVTHYIYALMGLRNLNEAAKIIIESHHFLTHFPDYYFACGIFYLDYIMEDPDSRIRLLPKIEEAYKQAIAIGETDLYDSVKGTGSYAAYYNLGVFYETTGQNDKAREAYLASASFGYRKAEIRLEGQ